MRLVAATEKTEKCPGTNGDEKPARLLIKAVRPASRPVEPPPPPPGKRGPRKLDVLYAPCDSRVRFVLISRRFCKENPRNGRGPGSLVLYVN